MEQEETVDIYMNHLEERTAERGPGSIMFHRLADTHTLTHSSGDCCCVRLLWRPDDDSHHPGPGRERPQTPTPCGGSEMQQPGVAMETARASVRKAHGMSKRH